jgi:hypothetical protein
MQRTGASEARPSLNFLQAQRAVLQDSGEARGTLSATARYQQPRLLARQLLLGRHGFEAYHQCAEARRPRRGVGPSCRVGEEQWQAVIEKVEVTERACR